MIYLGAKSEGFADKKNMIKERDCKAKAKTMDGSFTWANGVCYAPCGSGKKMRGTGGGKCGPLDDRFTDDTKKYSKGSAEYTRFYKPDLFTPRGKAYY
jgi:hypothetical protein